MHPLLRLPYAALGAAADAAAALAPAGDSKWLRSLRGRRGLAARYRDFARQRDPGRPLAWFHAPSVGEGLQALPVHRLVRDADAARQTAITWFSPSAAAFAQRFGADFADYLPFDSSRGARLALDALHPSALVYAKLDVWPVLTETAARRGVPLGLVAATLAEGGGRQGRLARLLLRDAYARLDRVGAISGEDAERLVQLGVRRGSVSVTGDTRYDQVWERVQRVDRAAAPLAALLNGRPTLVAGSTWPADEEVLLPAWALVRQRVPSARLIIAPHEPDARHLAPLEDWTRAEALRTARVGEATARDASVVLVDRVGLLADLYAAGTAAYVGGGFHAAGLHSVLEPAAHGMPVAFGPRHGRSRDAALLLDAGAARSAATPPELADVLGEWLADPVAAGQAGAASLAVIRAGLGAAVRSAALVEELLGRRVDRTS